jgi:hypothetical protein
MCESSNTDPRRSKYFLAAGTYFQPAISGRQERAGMRQSIPSSEGLQEYPLW